MRRLVVWALVSTAACGGDDTSSQGNDGGDGGDNDAGAVITWTPDQIWGPEGGELPPGAEEITAQELADLFANGEADLITPGGLATASDADARKTAESFAMLADIAAADPGLAWIVPRPATASSTLTPLADGNNQLLLADGETVITHGVAWETRERADSLRAVQSRASREDNVRILLEELPADQRADLPAPTALGGLTDSELDALDRTVLVRAQLWSTSEKPLSAGNAVAHAPNPGTGCVHSPQQFYERLDWPLKQYTTPIRRQGHRGTCVAFGVVAAAEIWVAKTRGIATDYSEQELYAVAKGIWTPTSDAYGDGLSTAAVLDTWVDTQYAVDVESAWTYNRSTMRVDDEDNGTYSSSCVDYTGYCSDTNHQMKVVCAVANGNYACGYRRPPEVLGGTPDPVRATGRVALWNLLEPESSMARMRVHLDAGRPIVLGFSVDNKFKYAAEQYYDPNDFSSPAFPGTVSNSLWSEDLDGGHAVTLVGYIPNTDPIFDLNVANTPGEGGGYFIAKNSWGCGGDGGYMYLSYGWVAAQASSASAIKPIISTIEAPHATLSASKSNVNVPTTVTLTAQVNAATTRIEVFRNGDGPDEGNAPDPAVFTRDIATPSAHAETFSLPFSLADNGLHSYWALTRDQFGNVTTSNLVPILVQMDAVAPEITITATPATVSAPGTITLRANAFDNTGVTKVRFFRGFHAIGEDVVAPYAINLPVTLADVGENPFVAIAYDGAGNMKMSQRVDVAVTAQLRPLITQFSANLAGNEVTLTWASLNATGVAIGGVGVTETSGTHTLPISQTTTYTMAAFNNAGTTYKTVTVAVSPAPAPIITKLTATPDRVQPGATTTLAWNVYGSNTTLSIDHGVGDVTGMTSKVVTIPAGDYYTLTATNPNGTSMRRIFISTEPDLTNPTVSLATNSSIVVLPGSVTLTATATDNVGVKRVDFHKNGTLFASDTTPGDGFTANVPLTSSDIGTVTFTARATDTSNRFTDSTPKTVSVVAQPTGLALDLYVSPTGNDASNNCEVVTTPCRTLLYASSLAEPLSTIVLLDGIYDATNQGAGSVILDLPFVDLVAANEGAARIGITLEVTGAGTIDGLRIDSTVSATARLEVNAMDAQLIGISLAGTHVSSPGLLVEGDSSVTIEPGVDPNLAAGAQFSATHAAMVRVTSGTLTLNGVTFAGAGVGFAFDVTGGTLSLNNVALSTRQNGIVVANGALNISNSTITGALTDVAGSGVVASTNATVTMNGSTISGFVSTAVNTPSFGIGTANTGATITITGGALSNNEIGFQLSAGSRPTQVTLAGVAIEDNELGGFVALGHAIASLSSCTIEGNGWRETAVGQRYGGVFFGPSGMHTVTMRDTFVRNNLSAVANTATANNAGVTMRGLSAVTFDLGTAAAPGGNTFVGNQAANLLVGSPGVTATAIGNTFVANEQGADATGRFVLGTAPCGATTCSVTTGSGVNYQITSGSLVLAGN